MDSVIELCLSVCMRILHGVDMMRMHMHDRDGRRTHHAAGGLIDTLTQTPRLPYVPFPINNQDKMADGAGSLDAIPSDA